MGNNIEIFIFINGIEEPPIKRLWAFIPRIGDYINLEDDNILYKVDKVIWSKKEKPIVSLNITKLPSITDK